MIPTIYRDILQEMSNGKKLTAIIKKRNLDYKKTHNELTSVRGVLNAKTTNHMIAICVREGIIE